MASSPDSNPPSPSGIHSASGPPAASGDRLDFFISYHHADEPWAKWIAVQLEQVGYRTMFMGRDFPPGSNFVLNMHKALSDAECTIAVLSPAYLASPFCASEWAAAFAKDPTGTQRKLLLVRVADCQADGLLTPFVRIEILDLPETVAREALLEGVKGDRHKPVSVAPFPGGPQSVDAMVAPLVRGPAAFPSDLPPVWTVPFPPNPYFTGRDALLGELHKALAPAQTDAAPQPVMVHGLGGVGKTQLAVEYAWRHRDEYSAVLWTRADSPETLDAGLAALSGRDGLALPEADAPELRRQRDAVLAWLRGNRRWLLVLDNADTPEAVEAIQSLLPVSVTRSGYVLITSRRTDWPIGVASIEVEVLTPDAAADFLLQRVTPRPGYVAGTRGDSLRLAEELGRLPLALEQAAALIARQGKTFGHSIEELGKARATLLSHRVEGGTGYNRSVAETWRVAESSLSPTARAILRLMGFLAPALIPRGLFAPGSAALREAVAAIASEAGLAPPVEGSCVDTESALADLAALSLVTLEPESVLVHSLVQAVQADALAPEDRRTWTECALNLVNEFVPRDQPEDVRTWPVWDRLWPHAEYVAAAADSAGITEPTGRLMNYVGVYFWGRAAFLHAEVLCRRAGAIDERVLGSNHPKIAVRLGALAALLLTTNRLAEAEPLMRRCLCIVERTLGPDHPETAKHLNNLAQLLKATNRLAEAEPLVRRAVAISEKSHGVDHPNVASYLNNLASLLEDTNRLAEARSLACRALAIDEKAFGPEHPSVGRDLNNLAQILLGMNCLKEAEPFMRRALAIKEKAYGPDHPKVATSLNNLAALLHTTSRYSEAEPLVRRALSIDENAFGPDHPKLAVDLNNLAQLLQATKHLTEAEPLMRRALAIDERSYGLDHPSVARDLSNLAALLQTTGRLSEAEKLMRRVLAIEEKAYRQDHPDLALGLNNLAWLLKLMNRLAAAEPLARRAVAIGKKTLVPSHPNIELYQKNLAAIRKARREAKRNT